MINHYIIEGSRNSEFPEVEYFGFASAIHSRGVDILHGDLSPPPQTHVPQPLQ